MGRNFPYSTIDCDEEPDEEQHIADWLNEMQDRGFPVTRRVLLFKLKEFLEPNPDRVTPFCYNKPPKKRLGQNERGWINSPNCKGFIHKIFHPFVIKRGVKFPIILFVDGHASHIAIEVADLCKSLGIILISRQEDSGEKNVTISMERIIEAYDLIGFGMRTKIEGDVNLLSREDRVIRFFYSEFVRPHVVFDQQRSAMNNFETNSTDIDNHRYPIGLAVKWNCV
ncbi:uncharacterized protein LOC121598724 [Anopheles merus]|uniref:uncharacterized protein LOC121598724 n=1 Tax=Anopheles merus TaxID=30066 RepID=UPI001BE4236E|nr:uncharacterized protein LOC121598724 [Anopheles merus]